MMCHLYFSRYELFNCKYEHNVITNALHLNNFFPFFFSLLWPLQHLALGVRPKAYRCLLVHRRQKYYISWIPGTNIVDHPGYKAKALCMVDTIHKYCESCAIPCKHKYCRKIHYRQSVSLRATLCIHAYNFILSQTKRSYFYIQVFLLLNQVEISFLINTWTERLSS